MDSGWGTCLNDGLLRVFLSNTEFQFAIYDWLAADVVQWMVVTDGHGKYVSGKVLHDTIRESFNLFTNYKETHKWQINVLNILTIQNFRSSSSLEMSPSVFPSKNLQHTQWP